MRLDYVDRLRNLGILFLFPFHTARVFDASNPFYVQGETDPFSTGLVRLAFWFMPLLFVLAGIASRFALGRRTPHEYLRERRRRLLYPFLFGVVLIVPPQAYYAAAFHHGDPGSYPAFLWSYFTDFSDWSEYGGGIGLGQLWFIILLYGVATLSLPLLGLLERRNPSSGPINHPLGTVALPGLALAALALLPDVLGKNLFVYAAFFLLGYLLVRDEATLAAVERFRLPFLLLGATGGAAVLVEAATVGAGQSPLAASWRAALSWVAVLALLGYGRRYLNRRTALSDYFSPAAFPVYVLHQTFLVVIAYYVVPHTDHGPVPFLAIMSGSLALSLAGYELLRRTRWTRFVLGIPSPRPGPATPARPDAMGSDRTVA